MHSLTHPRILIYVISVCAHSLTHAEADECIEVVYLPVRTALATIQRVIAAAPRVGVEGKVYAWALGIAMATATATAAASPAAQSS